MISVEAIEDFKNECEIFLGKFTVDFSECYYLTDKYINELKICNFKEVTLLYKKYGYKKITKELYDLYERYMCILQAKNEAQFYFTKCSFLYPQLYLHDLKDKRFFDIEFYNLTNDFKELIIYFDDEIDRIKNNDDFYFYTKKIEGNYHKQDNPICNSEIDNTPAWKDMKRQTLMLVLKTFEKTFFTPNNTAIGKSISYLIPGEINSKTIANKVGNNGYTEYDKEVFDLAISNLQTAIEELQLNKPKENKLK